MRSIAQTLTRASLFTTGPVLLLASLALAAYDHYTFRDAAVARLAVQARIVAANSGSALVFDDPGAATTTIRALASAPTVVQAAIYTPEGERFATYTRNGETTQPPEQREVSESEASGYEADRLWLSHPIQLNGRLLGEVWIESDLSELRARRTAYLQMLGLLVTLALGASLVISRLAHRNISEPISELAGTVRAIATRKDFSLRSQVRSTTREIAELSRTFNVMLQEIQTRDASLVEAQEQLEARVQQRTAELDAVNKELEAFSYSVSHDLRAPLRHITGFSEMLIDHAGPALDDKSRRYLDTITRASRRMAQLIDDLLAFSRISRSTLQRRAIDLNVLVKQARDEVLASTSAAGRRIEWRIAPLPEVHADPPLLHLVFVNLLSNAVKYTAPREVAEIEVGTAPGPAGHVVIFVRDNGVGFDMQYANKLFGVFQRLHRADEFEGTGIGLANVRRIVTRHGGNVWAESTLNQSATFYVSLPTEVPPS